MSKSVKKKLLFTVGALVSLFSSWSLSQNNFLMPIWTLQHALHCNAGEEQVICHVLKYVTGDKPQRLVSVYSLQSHVKLVLRLLSYCCFISECAGDSLWLVDPRDGLIGYRSGDGLYDDTVMDGQSFILGLPQPADFMLPVQRCFFIQEHVGVDYLFIWLSFSHVFVS